MSLSRRRFLEIGSLVAASSAIPLPVSAAGAQVLSLSQETSLHSLSSARAEALIGESFSVEAGLGRPLQMKLVAVDDLPHYKGQTVTGEGFVLKFRLKQGSAVPQGTYIFDNKKVGRCSLLIVPSAEKIPHYMAVINHRLPGRG